MRDKILDSINNDSDSYLIVAAAVLLIFIGFILGNVTHDSAFHPVEQSIKNERELF